MSDFALALSALAALDRAGLAARWEEVFGCPAPRRCQSPLLQGALAWRLQLQQSGQSLGAVARLTRSLRPSTGVSTLTPGTRLLRDWQGQTHHVLVTAEGFEYAGAVYRSLTAISRKITGTAWSGPLFFGLRK